MRSVDTGGSSEKLSIADVMSSHEVKQQLMDETLARDAAPPAAHRGEQVARPVGPGEHLRAEGQHPVVGLTLDEKVLDRARRNARRGRRGDSVRPRLRRLARLSGTLARPSATSRRPRTRAARCRPSRPTADTLTWSA